MIIICTYTDIHDLVHLMLSLTCMLLGRADVYRPKIIIFNPLQRTGMFAIPNTIIIYIPNNKSTKPSSGPSIFLPFCPPTESHFTGKLPPYRFISFLLLFSSTSIRSLDLVVSLHLVRLPAPPPSPASTAPPETL